MKLKFMVAGAALLASVGLSAPAAAHPAGAIVRLLMHAARTSMRIHSQPGVSAAMMANATASGTAFGVSQTPTPYPPAPEALGRARAPRPPVTQSQTYHNYVVYNDPGAGQSTTHLRRISLGGN